MGTLRFVLEKFAAHLHKSGLIQPGEKVIVGYSGGADSSCLLHLLHKAGVTVIAAHLHHGMRPEADKELQLCEVFCQELDIPFLSGRADVPKMSADLKIGLEEAGRMARYNFLQQALIRLEADYIATAHTGSDSVETTLFNLARGTGPGGLSGIPESRDRIIRPLLPFMREETRAYCREHGFWFHDDPANSDVNFSRARIRHRVLPELKLINPGFEQAILRMSSILEEEDQFLNGAAAAGLERAEIKLNGDLHFLTSDAEIALEVRSMQQLPPVLFKRAMRLAFGALGGSLDHAQVNLISELFGQSKDGSVTAEGGTVTASWDAERIHVRQNQPTEPFRYKLTVPGETESEQFGWQFTAYEGPAEPIPDLRAGLAVQIEPKSVKGELFFRSLQPGDEIMPLGFGHRRKLSDVLSDARLTQAARARLPIVCDLIGPIWAPGVCLSERVRRQSASERLLILKFGPILDVRQS